MPPSEVQTLQDTKMGQIHLNPHFRTTFLLSFACYTSIGPLEAQMGMGAWHLTDVFPIVLQSTGLGQPSFRRACLGGKCTAISESPDSTSKQALRV